MLIKSKLVKPSDADIQYRVILYDESGCFINMFRLNSDKYSSQKRTACDILVRFANWIQLAIMRAIMK